MTRAALKPLISNEPLANINRRNSIIIRGGRMANAPRPTDRPLVVHHTVSNYKERLREEIPDRQLEGDRQGDMMSK